MTYDSEFERRLQEFAASRSGLMVGDTFIVEGVTYRVTAHDGFGAFHFEQYPTPAQNPYPA